MFDEDLLAFVSGLYYDCLGLVFLLLFATASELFVKSFLDLIKLLPKFPRPRHRSPHTSRIIPIIIILPIKNRTHILSQFLLPRAL